MKTSFRICVVVAATVLLGIASPQGRGVQGPPVQGQSSPNFGQGRGGQSPASQRPPQTDTPQAYPPEQIQAGQAVFQQQCAFCHGRDAGGGETGPDLTRSNVVAEDVRGDKIGIVVRGGRADKGMPQFNLSDQDMAAVVAFIHDQKTKADSEQGGRKGVDVADLQTGHVDEGRQFFNGAGKCSSCHSATGDLAGVAGRYQGLALLERMLYPVGRGAKFPATVIVMLPSGQMITGKLEYRDEFSIALTDSSGKYRSWPTNKVKFTVDAPVNTHGELLGKYTDADMHNVLAYLEALK